MKTIKDFENRPDILFKFSEKGVLCKCKKKDLKKSFDILKGERK